MAEARTLKLNFVVKQWQNQKIIFGILIYALCRFQNHKNPVGRIDTLIQSVRSIGKFTESVSLISMVNHGMNIIISIGNHMILSAIWDKSAQVIFQRPIKLHEPIGRVQFTSAD